MNKWDHNPTHKHVLDELDVYLKCWGTNCDMSLECSLEIFLIQIIHN